MLRTAVTGLILGTMVATSGFAGHGLLGVRLAQSHLPKASQKPLAIPAKTNATDFSGNWIGTCTYIDGPVPMEIDQSDDMIIMDGQAFTFGAMTTTGASDKDSYENTQMRATWNATKTTLTFNATGVMTHNDDKNIYTFIFEDTMKLQDNQIQTKIRGNLYSETTTAQNLDGTCTFTKVS